MTTKPPPQGKPGGLEPAEATAAESEELSFGAALEQLEKTLQRMEDDAIDIDDLAEELRHASKLLEVCRGKLRSAEVEVREIVEGMAEDEARLDPGTR